MAAARKPQNTKLEKKIRSTDSKARVMLPKGFTNTLVDVEQLNEFEVVIRKVETIPSREAWLWRNSKAIGAVMAGLDEAKQGEFVPGPDLATDAAEFGAED